MDLLRLGPPFGTTYQPDKVITGYSSLIWTERFQDHGEFQLQTANIQQALIDLPKFTLVSHRDTDDVHMCETYELTEDQYRRPILQISGKSLTSYLDHRWVEAPYQKRRKMARNYTPVGALALLVWQAFCNDTGVDVSREADRNWTTRDVIPNTIVTDSVAYDGFSHRKWLQEGSLWPQMQPLLNRADVGIRVIRPTENTIDTEKVTVTDFPLEDRGAINRTAITHTNALRFDIYAGTDRRLETDTPVVFSRPQGQITNTKFLESIANYKTALEIMSSVAVPDHYRPGQYTLSGLARRVFGYDAGAPDFPDEPEKPKDLKSNATAAQKKAHAKAIDTWLDEHQAWELKTDQIRADFLEDIDEDLNSQLRDHKKLAIYTGDILPNAKLKYRQHYFLGDKVTLYGEKNTQDDMIVTEYVRSEDKNGDVGVPTLTAPDYDG